MTEAEMQALFDFIMACCIIALIEIAIVIVAIFVRVIFEHYRNPWSDSRQKSATIHYGFAVGDFVTVPTAMSSLTIGKSYEVMATMVDSHNYMLSLFDDDGERQWHDAEHFVPYHGPDPRLEKLSEAYDEIMQATLVMENINAPARQDQNL